MMRILDINNNEISNPNLELGRLVEEKVFIAHHDAIKEVKEAGHYKTIRKYANGGQDVEWVIDIPGVEAKDAWDEYEDIMRYIPYTEEELAEIEELKNKPTIESRLEVLEANNSTKEDINALREYISSNTIDKSDFNSLKNMVLSILDILAPRQQEFEENVEVLD